MSVERDKQILLFENTTVVYTECFQYTLRHVYSLQITFIQACVQLFINVTEVHFNITTV